MAFKSIVAFFSIGFRITNKLTKSIMVFTIIAINPKTAIMVITLGMPLKKLDFVIKKQSKKQRLHIKANLFKKFIVFMLISSVYN